MSPHANSGTSTPQEGRYARTDERMSISMPSEADMPHSPTIQGMTSKRTLNQFSLEDKVSVVTGGARGLGLTMVQALLSSGSHIAIVDLNGEEAKYQAQNLREQWQRENKELGTTPTITAHSSDVANPTSVDQAIADILEKHGRIDNLVTSAGFTENFDAIHYPHERMQKCWAVNVDGTYLWSVGVARHLIERKVPGSIVMIGSMSGAIVNVPQPQAPYNAAKAAVRQLASSFAVEWAKYDIRVNVISPGYMLTDLTKKILEEKPELHQKWTSLIPNGKMGQPQDIMGPVTFLLSDASKYMTGADLRVDGGYTLT